MSAKFLMGFFFMVSFRVEKVPADRLAPSPPGAMSPGSHLCGRPAGRRCGARRPAGNRQNGISSSGNVAVIFWATDLREATGADFALWVGGRYFFTTALTLPAFDV